MPTEPESRYWVVAFGLRAEKVNLFELTMKNSFYGDHTALGSKPFPAPAGEITNATESNSTSERILFGGTTFGIEPVPHLNEIHERLITCMYYALTTLSTVGYGDFYPMSIAEKILGSII